MNFTYYALHQRQFALLTSVVLSEQDTSQQYRIKHELNQIFQTDVSYNENERQLLKDYIDFLGERCYQHPAFYAVLIYGIVHQHIDPRSIPPEAMNQRIFNILSDSGNLSHLTFEHFSHFLMHMNVYSSSALFCKMPLNFFNMLKEHHDNNTLSACLKERLHALLHKDYHTLPTCIRDILNPIFGYSLNIYHEQDHKKKENLTQKIYTIKENITIYGWNSLLPMNIQEQIVELFSGKELHNQDSTIPVGLMDPRSPKIIRRLNLNIFAHDYSDLLDRPLEESVLWHQWNIQGHLKMDMFPFEVVECVILLEPASIETRVMLLNEYLVKNLWISHQEVLNIPLATLQSLEQLCEYLEQCFEQRTHQRLPFMTIYESMLSLRLIQDKCDVWNLTEYLTINNKNPFEESLIL